ncbi:flagellar basal body M-ring protein FliF, partial [Pseudomonas aeruginosa]
ARVAMGCPGVLGTPQRENTPLYGCLNGVDAYRVVEALTAAVIPYKVEPNTGPLQVNADDLGPAPMKVASSGVEATDNN